mgnify:FL=1
MTHAQSLGLGHELQTHQIICKFTYTWIKENIIAFDAIQCK